MTIFFNDKARIVAGTDTNDAVTLGQLTAGDNAAKARANHTGTQLAVTISDLPAFVDARLTTLINGAPAALDTLGEIAAQLAADESVAAALVAQLTAANAAIAALQALPHAGRSLAVIIGDGVAQVFNIDHNWALADPAKVRVELVNRSTGETELANIARVNGNRVTVTFATPAPSVGAYSVLLTEVP